MGARTSRSAHLTSRPEAGGPEEYERTWRSALRYRQALLRVWSVFHFSTPATSSHVKTCGFLRGVPSTQAKTRHCDWLLAPFLVSIRTSLATAAPAFASP